MLKKFGTTLALTVGLGLGMGVTAHAGVIFEDNFDSTVGSNVLNWGGNATWGISGGTVDLIDMPNGFGISCEGGAGKCIDLDGSTSNAGVLATNASFTFDLGVLYTIEFDISGNQRGGSVDDIRVEVAAGLASIGIFNIPSNYAWNTFSLSFYGDGSSGNLTFADQGADNIGVILDNVRLLREDDNRVPEPGALALLGLGLVGAGLARRRRA